MSIGRPSASSSSANDATDASDERSSAAHLDAGTRRALADARRGVLALLEVADRHDELGAGAREAGGDLESDAVARAGDESERVR